MKFTKFFILVFSVSLLVGCKKQVTHHPVSTEFKEWTLYQVGSYWIYRNDSTSVLDSVYLPQPPFYEVCYDADHLYDTYEHFYIKFQSSFIMDAYLTSRKGGGDDLQVRFYGGGGVPVLESKAEINKFYGDSSTTYYLYKERLQNYQFEGNSYPEVIHSIYQQTGNSIDIYNFLIAKNVGLIKVYGTWNDTTRSWSLLRYRAVQ